MKNGIKLIDNSIPLYQLRTIISELLKEPTLNEVAIATGYWDLPGMADIFEELSIFLGRENVRFRLVLS